MMAGIIEFDISQNNKMSIRLVFPAKYFSDIYNNNTQMNIVAVYVSFD